MKFRCKDDIAEYNAKLEWHAWFAWYPVRVGSTDCRWLEIVERKGRIIQSWHESWLDYEYRPLGDNYG